MDFVAAKNDSLVQVATWRDGESLEGETKHVNKNDTFSKSCLKLSSSNGKQPFGKRTKLDRLKTNRRS